MNKTETKFHALKYIALISTLLWIVSGTIILGSIYFSNYQIGFLANIVIGILFILVGIYIYFKNKWYLKLLKSTYKEKNLAIIKKVFLSEVIFFIVALLLGLVMITAVSSRVFGEGYAVFG